MIKSWNKYTKCDIKTNSYHLHFQRHRWSEIEGFEFLLGLEDVLRPSCNRGWHALTIKGRGQILICESKIASYCCFLLKPLRSFKRLITYHCSNSKMTYSSPELHVFFSLILIEIDPVLFLFYFFLLVTIERFRAINSNVRLHFEVI